MLLELGKMISLLASILLIYPAAMSAFFTPGMHWEERIAPTLLNLLIAGCVCVGSGVLFAWPLPAHGPARLYATLPVQIFLWSILLIAALFALSWFWTCGDPWRLTFSPTCG